jgi:hypothetical protein
LNVRYLEADSYSRRNWHFKSLGTRIYICTYMHAYVHIHKPIYTYIHIHTYIYIHACILTFIHTCTHTYIHIHTYVSTYIHTYIHTYTHTPAKVLVRHVQACKLLWAPEIQINLRGFYKLSPYLTVNVVSSVQK